MKLLLTTQVVDQNDSNLGFFHKWIEELAKKVDKLTVICLFEGEHDLPDNVQVFSLGKENKKWFHGFIATLLYCLKFYKYIFRERKNYDHVFVHMNPEYVVLGGVFWRMWHKKVLFWYTHKAVNLKLRLAEKLATKIFTASKESFRLPSKKVEVVGHGIDVDSFALAHELPLDNGLKLLSVGRISSVKKIETAIMAVAELKKIDPNLKTKLTIIGEPITKADKEYKKSLEENIKTNDLSQSIEFVGSKNHQDLIKEYKNYHALLHSSETGSVDKVVLEALAAGLTVFSSSEAYNMADELVDNFPKGDYKILAQYIEKKVKVGIMRQVKAGEFIRNNFSLNLVINKIVKYFL